MSVILAFTDDRSAVKVNQVLAIGGFHTRGVCKTGAQVLRAVLRGKGRLIVCAYHLRDMTAFDLFEKLQGECPMLLLSNEYQYEANEDGIVCLHTPVNQATFLSTVGLLLRDFGDIWTRDDRRPRTQTENELVFSAKKRLMERFNMEEPQAHRFLQKRSMNTGTTLTETARIILEEF